jgi:hypothetical protein
MPSYFSDGNEPKLTDSADRLLHKFASLARQWAGASSSYEPTPNDSRQRVLNKAVQSLLVKANA